jgi:hypothetical protein
VVEETEGGTAMRRWRRERVVLFVALVAVLVGLVLQAGAKELSGTRHVEQAASGAPLTVTVYDAGKEQTFRTIGTAVFVFGLVLLAIVFWRWIARPVKPAGVAVSRHRRRRRL